MYHIQLSSSVSFSQNAQLNINNCYSKKFLISNNNDSFCYNQPNLNANNKNLDSNYSIFSFETSLIMSTYLNAFVIGDYDYIEYKSETGPQIRVYTPVGKQNLGKFSLDVK